MSLKDYGWNTFFETAFEPMKARGWRPGRVILARRGELHLGTESAEIPARLSGRLQHRAGSAAELPAVGDWIAYETPEGLEEMGLIRQVLPRTTKISRKVAGERTDEQLVAANVDKIFLVMGLDGDFNLRRLERMLVMAWDSGALPIVLLNKADLCPEAGAKRARAESVAPGVEVRLLSCQQGRGLPELEAIIHPGETIALIGSSGVGKSTLINRLLGDEKLRTRAVRRGDDRGRHTTTHRELVRLLGGGLLIDNPGIRELQLWSHDQTSSIGGAFDDIEQLSVECRYQDCAHGSEPDCAVRGAVAVGALSAERLESYFKLQKELHYLSVRQDEGAQREQRRKWRAIHKAMRKLGSHRRT